MWVRTALVTQCNLLLLCVAEDLLVLLLDNHNEGLSSTSHHQYHPYKALNFWPEQHQVSLSNLLHTQSARMSTRILATTVLVVLCGPFPLLPRSGHKPDQMSLLYARSLGHFRNLPRSSAQSMTSHQQTPLVVS